MSITNKNNCYKLTDITFRPNPVCRDLKLFTGITVGVKHTQRLITSDNLFSVLEIGKFLKREIFIID